MVIFLLLSQNVDKQSEIRRLFIRCFDNKMVMGDSLDFRPIEDKQFHSICDWITKNYGLQQ
jgi:hypothetical protein